MCIHSQQKESSVDLLATWHGHLLGRILELDSLLYDFTGGRLILGVKNISYPTLPVVTGVCLSELGKLETLRDRKLFWGNSGFVQK